MVDQPTREQLTTKTKNPYLGSIRKVCPSCGENYKTYISQNNKFCTRKCAFDLQKSQTILRKTKHCLICSKPFVPKHPDSPGLYCSYACCGVSNRKPIVLRSGYEYIFDPQKAKNNKQGYFPLHHMIFENFTSVELKHDEVIHHINKVRDDNSINNLMLLSKSSHSRLHANKFIRGDGGEILGQH